MRASAAAGPGAIGTPARAALTREPARKATHNAAEAPDGGEPDLANFEQQHNLPVAALSRRGQLQHGPRLRATVRARAPSEPPRRAP
jgi:hypothetical protein